MRLIFLILFPIISFSQEQWTGLHLQKDLTKRIKFNLKTEARFGEEIKTFVQPSIYIKWKVKFNVGYRVKTGYPNRVFLDTYKGVKLKSIYLQYRLRLQQEDTFTLRNKVKAIYKKAFVSTELSTFNFRFRTTIGATFKIIDNIRLLVFYRWQTDNDHITGTILKIQI